MGRRERILFPCALAIAGGCLLAGAACDSFSEGTDAPREDAGSDALSATDDATSQTDGGAARDGGNVACEALVSEPHFDFADGTGIAADAFYVYVSSAAGVRRNGAATAGALVDVTDDSATAVVVTDDYVVWRRVSGAIADKPSTNLGAAASVPFTATNTNRLEPRTGNQFLVTRNADVWGCTAGGGCAGPVLNRASVRSVVARGTSFDFLADSAGGTGVFTCVSGCDVADAGALLLATAGVDAPDLVSDAAFIYWIDRDERKVRRVNRAGGPIEDVMVDIVGGRFVALDPQGRVVVGTDLNGVFRGASNATCHAVGGSGEVKALAVGPTATFVLTSTEVRKIVP